MSSSDLHGFEASLADSWNPADWRDVTVVAAISGGADSVALLRALARLKENGVGRLIVAHFNHRLRREAWDDERFVTALAETLGVDSVVGGADVAETAASSGETIEEAARRLRYAFLERSAERFGARFVVTAHTADDQAETILHRIVRGTGIGGLAGIARTRPLGHASLIRPMLGFRRRDVLAYVSDLGQCYREDASNEDRRYSRNRIRHELLPLLAESYNAQVVEAILRLGGLAAEAQEVVDRVVEEKMGKAVCVESDGCVRICAKALADQPSYAVRELLLRVWSEQNWPLQAMGCAQWTQMAEMLASSRGKDFPTLDKAPHDKAIFPGAVAVEIVPDGLRLSRA